MAEDVPAVKKRQNYVLYSLTGLILIILTGVKYLMGSDSPEAIIALGRFAMPFFFIISGYYLYSKDGRSEKSLPRKIKHILGIIIVVKLLYLLFDVFYYAAGMISLDYLITAFVVCEQTTMHVWFVYALFLLYLWWHVMEYFHWNKGKIAFVLSVIVIVSSITFGVILRLMGVDSVFGISTLYINEIIYPFIGIPFFSIGYYLHKYHEKFDEKFSTPVLLIITLIGLFVPMVTSLYAPKSTLYLGSVLASVGLFMLTYRVPEDRLRCKSLEYAGKYLKPFLYMYFPAVVFFMKNVALKSLEHTDVNMILGAVISMAANVIVSYLTFKLAVALVHRKKSNA